VGDWGGTHTEFWRRSLIENVHLIDRDEERLGRAGEARTGSGW
jgi:hypothetical protein